MSSRKNALLDMTLALLFTQFIFLSLGTGLAAAQTEQQPVWTYYPSINIFQVKISADGNYVVAGDHDGAVYLFSRTDNTPIWSYSTGASITSVAISSDGRYIVAANSAGNVYFFVRASSTPQWTHSVGGDVVYVKISADGTYIAAANQDYSTQQYPYEFSKVFLFSKTSSTPVWTYSTWVVDGGNGALAYSIAISSDGNYIAAGFHDSKVQFFSRTSSTPIWEYSTSSEFERYISSVVISSNGAYVAAGVSDSTYDDTSGKVYLFSNARTDNTVGWNYAVSGYLNPVKSVSISEDGNYIIAGTLSSGPYLFSRTSGTPSIDYATGQALSTAISSDGSYIATSGSVGIYMFTNSSSSPLWRYASNYSVSMSSDGSYLGISDGINTSLLSRTVVMSGTTDDNQTSDNQGTTENQATFTFTFLKSDNTPLANTVIYWGTEDGRENTLLGTTNSQGVLTSNENFAGVLMYIASEDNVYQGTKYVSLSGEISSDVSMFATGTPTTPSTPSSDITIYLIIPVVVVALVVVSVVARQRKSPA